MTDDAAADMLGGLGHGQVLLGDRAYDSDALRTPDGGAGYESEREAEAQQQAAARVQPVLV